MSFNKIYSGMENAPQAIDENFNNSYPKDEILTEETAAALGVLDDNPTPEMAFKKITEGATGIAMLSKPDAKNWDSGNFEVMKDRKFVPKLVGATDAGDFKYARQYGAFTRFGNIIFATITLDMDEVLALPKGDLTVSGLPAPVAKNGVLGSNVMYSIGGNNHILRSLSHISTIRGTIGFKHSVMSTNMDNMRQLQAQDVFPTIGKLTSLAQLFFGVIYRTDL